MKVASIDLYRYALPLKKPYTVNKLSLTTREGFIVRVETDDGIAGFGDVAPLPSLSDEVFDHVLEEGLRVARSLTGCNIPRLPGQLSDRFERWLFAHYLSPSLNFGLQTAFLHIWAKIAGKTLASYLNSEAPKSILVNALLACPLSEFEVQLQSVRSRGLRSIKVKVGKEPIEREVAKVRLLREGLGTDISVRLDANRTWEQDDALAFARQVVDWNIEYIEEPLRDPTGLVSFAARSGLRCAIDETLMEKGWDYLERWRGVYAAILKPTLLGGFEATMWLARRAANVGMIPIVTSTLESGVGVAALAQFAATVQPAHVAAGLDTTSLFRHDVMKKPIVQSGGIIHLEETNVTDESLDWTCLRHVNDE